MSRGDSDQREALVARLTALRDDGRLTSAIVRAAARSAGVHERAVWRWLAARRYEPVRRAGWRTTPTAMEALYRCAGRPTAAWRLLRDEGVGVPSRTVFCDALKRDLSPAERAYARHGEDGRRRYSVYRRWEPAARNEIWEADHAQLDINVLPPRGRRLVRPWLTVIEDGFSRLVMGWALSLQPTSAEVLVAIREAIVIDPDRGPWGGVPQLIRFDGGREFLARAVARAAAELGCAALPAAPYSPHQKGKIERLHRTIGAGLIATLPHYMPHYTAGPHRADGTLYAQLAPLTLPQLQTRLREFIDAYNTEHAHASLGRLTPAQKWATSAAPLDIVEPERLRWMLMADQTRRVLKDGIHFGGAIFIAPELTRIGGRNVEVRYMPHDLRFIEVFTEDGWLCTAHPQDERVTANPSDSFIGLHKPDYRALKAGVVGVAGAARSQGCRPGVRWMDAEQPPDGVTRDDRARNRLCSLWDVDVCDVPCRDLVDVEQGDLGEPSAR